jgi:hypothetical protein
MATLALNQLSNFIQSMQLKFFTYCFCCFCGREKGDCVSVEKENFSSSRTFGNKRVSTVHMQFTVKPA